MGLPERPILDGRDDRTAECTHGAAFRPRLTVLANDDYVVEIRISR